MNQRDELIAKAREVARGLGTQSLGCREFSRRTGISPHRVERAFDSWGEFCREAGLEPAHPVKPLSDDTIFSAMRDAFLEIGGVGTYRNFDRHFRYSAGLLYRRKMTWTEALVAFRAWALTHAPDFPYMGQLPETVPPPPRKTRAPRTIWAQMANGAVPGEGGPAAPVSWPADDSRTLGEVVNFRALLHAPVNEAGVLVLFGMVAGDLGFVIETVAAGFPDCEAKRRVAPREKGTARDRGARWQRVRIEFEFRSRNFRHHGHDPEACDLVVCWEHNWPDCPIEVVELRAAIAALTG